MGMFEGWKKDVEKKFIKYKKEEDLMKKGSPDMRRCPKCFSMSIRYDPKTGKIYCTECGFETYIKI